MTDTFTAYGGLPGAEAAVREPDIGARELLSQIATVCTEALSADATGLMLADQAGQLRVLVSSADQSRLTSLLWLQHGDGPYRTAFATGRPVSWRASSPGRHRCPEFAHRMSSVGMSTLECVPLRLRLETIGVLNLFRAQPAEWTEPQLRLRLALAELATISLLQQQAIGRYQELTRHLRAGLAAVGGSGVSTLMDTAVLTPR